MSHTYCLRRLLEHGDLEWSELMAVTGWQFNQLRSAMARLLEAGIVHKRSAGPRRNVYGLAA